MKSVINLLLGLRSLKLLPFLVIVSITPPAAAAGKDPDAHIRAVVQAMLHEKDQKIEHLEARIRQLEQERNQSLPKAPHPTTEPSAAHATAAITPSEPLAPTHTITKTENSVDSKLQALEKKITSLKETAQENNLDLNGFFDINAKTGNSTDQTFSVGILELDIAYNYNEHFAASSALVLCGNSPGADYMSSPAHITCGASSLIGANNGSAAIGVGFVDYHLFDSKIPPRGRILNNQGLHIQAGRFDVPFMADYQNFANKDRVTITSPITTVRIQKGGFNGDGVRSYGSWGMFNYSLFWTNGVYLNDGSSIGGRLGMNLGQNLFRSHERIPDGIEFGLSHLTELNGHNEIRNAFYGVDLSLNYGMLRWQNEVVLHQGHMLLPNQFDQLGATTGYGKERELAYHSTLIADLADLTHYPLLAFARYGYWQSNQHFLIDGFDNRVVAINPISMLSLGLNYKFSDYLRIKLEYSDSLGSSTEEHFFDKRLGMAQMVVMF